MNFIGTASFLSIVFWLVYLGIKNYQQWDKTNKVKRAIFGICSIFFIVVGPFGGQIFKSYGTFGYIGDGYYWNDGPWLTWDDDPSTSIVINFATKNQIKVEVEYSTDPNFLSNVFNHKESEFSYIHHIRLNNLIPGTKYYYRTDINFENFEKNHVFNFSTAPTGKSNNFKFVIVGDMQPTDSRTQEGGRIVAQGIAKQNPAFVVQLGDISTTGGLLSFYHNALLNLPYFATSSPMMAAVGNHDYSADGGKNFNEIFSYNYAAETGYYHSFSYSNVHFLMLDNFVGEGSTLTQAQKDWIIEDITQARAQGHEWVFIAFNHSIMTTGTSGHNWELQKWLVPVADELGIDGVFFGHDHHYEHWNYTYGSSDLLYDENHVPSGNEVNNWCSGGGGAHLEVDYGLLTHDPYINIREFYNTSAAEYQNITIIRDPWNSERYVEDPKNEMYAESSEHKLYYHAPEIESYSSDNDIYGYIYGEQALHYLLVEISDDGDTCTISARYTSGDLISGPEGEYPQLFTFSK